MDPNEPVKDPESQREAALFRAALELPAEARGLFLDGACYGNPDQRQRLELLLKADGREDSFLEPAPRRDDGEAEETLKMDHADFDSASAVGHSVGRYKLLEKVGEGGCGVVYVAEQTEPVRRRVALKVIKLGMDTKAVVARFEAERQALAMMDHPNIARVLDAGTTGAGELQVTDSESSIPTGRPYFVMELVRGIKITDYCDQAQLSARDRIDLFVKVCHAIQHAHQKGIIHRDIKPSNILITLHDGMPVPKVIDFGIAKATEGRLTDATVYTQLHQFIGTPAYMSPEQAEMSGLDIDTRSDIYSLGVLLYELLASSTPFDPQELMALGIDEMRKTIREKEPPRPSTKLATLQGDDLATAAKRRSVDVSKILHQLRGDLDWIVMKCLEKDRSRRYDTANGLAADLKRHLNNEPVLARPPSTAYRCQMAFRRNKLVFGAGAAVAVALVVGIGISTWQAKKARGLRDIALAASASEVRERRIALDRLAQVEAAQSLADQKAGEVRVGLYAADMRLAQLALAGHDLGGAVELLEKHTPGENEPDDRGFEWRYLWQQARGDEIASLTASDSAIEELDFSPDGRLLAVGGVRGTKLIDVATWREQRVLGGTNRLLAVQFSPDGESLLIATKHDVQIWDTLTWQLKTGLEGVSGLAGFSPNGQVLVTLGLDGLQIRDGVSLGLWHRIPELSLHLQWGWLGNLTFSRDGRSLAALVEDATVVTNRVSIRIWDVAELRERGPAAASRRIHFPEVVSTVALALSEDGGQLAVSTVLGQLIVWDTATMSRLASHRDLSRTFGLQYRVRDGELIGVRADQTVRTWRQDGTNLVETSLRRGSFRQVFGLAVSPDGAYFATGDEAGEVKLWDDSGLRSDGVGDATSNDVVPDHMNLLEFLPDSRTLVCGGSFPEVDNSDHGILDFWDIETGQSRRTFSNVVWHAAARVSPNQRWVAIAGTNGPVELLDVTSQVVVATLEGHTNEVRRIHFTPDNRRVLTATVRQATAQGGLFANDSWVRLWEVPSGRLLAETNLLEDLRAIAMAPDGETFAVSLAGGEVQLRQTRDFAPVFRLLSRDDPICKLAFSPDGRLLAVSYGPELNICDLSERRLRYVGRAPSIFNWLTFSPDGKTLATASHDRTVKLWNVATGQEMLTLQFPGGCFQAEFSGDGRTLAVGTYDVGGGKRNINVHLVRAPSLAQIGAARTVGMGTGAATSAQGKRMPEQLEANRARATQLRKEERRLEVLRQEAAGRRD